jgi:hypothetical protein
VSEGHEMPMPSLESMNEVHRRELARMRAGDARFPEPEPDDDESGATEA